MIKPIQILPLMLAGLALTFATLGCSNKGTDTGNPSMQMLFSAYQAASVSQVTLCVHQIRFKSDNSSGETGENTNISAGLVTVLPNGTVIGDISVKVGTYRRIDVMVKDQCGTGNSIMIQNGNGTFSSSQPLTLRFIGELQVDVFSSALTLGITPFIGFWG
jgi:hypothetical protein